MRFSIPAIALFAAGALAVDISGAPACAQKCLLDSQGLSACDPNATTYTCFCADKPFYNAVVTCVTGPGGCGFLDALATLSWYNTVCPSS